MPNSSNTHEPWRKDERTCCEDDCVECLIWQVTTGYETIKQKRMAKASRAFFEWLEKARRL